MSWFNETFSDSLNSIKGQITKITKEVLAEDDNEKEEETETIRSKLKELDALCSSKDLEIASLREENKKISQRFQEELKFLRNENKRLRKDSKGKNEDILLGSDQIQQICELENELLQLRVERDHLEELQKDHQSNICLVMQQRDNSKAEFEQLRAAYSDLKSKYNELHNLKDDSKVTDSLCDVNLLEIQNMDDEIVNLRNIIVKLESQIESYQIEREETSKLVNRLTLENESMKEKIEKLIVEVKIVSSEKENAELENCKLKETVHALRNDLNRKDEEFEGEHRKQYEVEEKLRKLTETMENSKIEHSNLKKDLENQVNKLLNIFLINNMESGSLSTSINKIEIFWEKSLREKENAEKLYNENVNKLQNEIQILKDDKIRLENEIKIGNDKRNELECNYKKEISSLQNMYLELKSQQQNCLIKSQTDDVKRLDQEVTKLMETVELKNKELSECYNKINIVNQDLNGAKNLTANLEKELLKVTVEKDELQKGLLELKCILEMKEKEIMESLENEDKIKERCKFLEVQKTELLKQSESLQSQLDQAVKANKDLENQILSLKSMAERTAKLELHLEETIRSKSELEIMCENIEQIKLDSENQSECLKAQLIIKESSIAELSDTNQNLMCEIIKLKEELVKLQGIEKELNQCKEIMVEVEIQRQELLEQKELLEKRCAALGSELIAEKQKGDDFEHGNRQNANLIEICKKPQSEAQTKVECNEIKQEERNYEANNPEISSLQAEIENLRTFCQQQGNIIASFTHENNQLKHHIQLTSENLVSMAEENNLLKQVRSIEPATEGKTMVNLENQASRDKLNLQQHKRSKSDFDAANAEEMYLNKLRLELENLKESSQRQQKEYKCLQEQYAIVSEKEGHSRKELERLKLHLIEIENYYTETIDEYQTKLTVTEEQLKNSSTVYTSTKVRDNQHLESLQGQIRLISAQRDDLQVKLSAAEDEVQKHKAALASFHVVLEQFQQDKEREFESFSTKYENQCTLWERKFAELQHEINSLNNQLSDAKTGLKAASRLGEQLEKKSEQIAELEQRLADTKNEMKELEERAAIANQSNFGKVDKSLVKNLLLGYISAQKADRKSQVLRIMMSILDFDEEERNKIGVDHTQSGWLSHLIHPRGDGAQSSQSLSEAFIRFLENESRPQPQLKLLPEQNPQVDKPGSGSRLQPSLLLQELVLPTFNSPQTNESTILKDVLNDT